MKSMMMARAALATGLVIGLAGGAAGLAHAADVSLPADDLIAARQAGYDLQQGVVAQMKATVESGGPVKPLTDGAKGLSSWGHVIPSLFPVGTETGHDTKAKPEIWSDKAGFEKAAANFYAAADKLAVLADANDKAGFAAQFKETTAACGACHRQFKNR